MKCSCKSSHLIIDCTISVTYSSGTSIDMGEPSFTEISQVQCQNCGKEGSAKEFGFNQEKHHV